MAIGGIRLFPGAQGHDAVLGGADAGGKGLLKVIAADLDEMLAFLLARLAPLALVGAFQEVGGAGRGQSAPRPAGGSGWAGRSSKAIGGNHREG